MKNISVLLKSIFKYNKYQFILITLIIIIIGILEISLILGAQKFSSVIFDKDIRLTLNNQLIYFCISALLIAPTRLLFILYSGKLSINFEGELTGKLMTKQVKDWRPTDNEATSNITNTLITETDLLVNDFNWSSKKWINKVN